MSKQKRNAFTISWALFIYFFVFTHYGFASPPYPRSNLITSISFDQSTHITAAEGSDVWSCTWADDDNVYAAWGDGGGFGGTDKIGRVYMGVARIEGFPPNWNGVNVWGGKDQESSETPPPGKIAGIISVDDNMYIYVTKQDTWDKGKVMRSTNHGLTWDDLGWVFTTEEEQPFVNPGILQLEKNNVHALGEYIYGYSVGDVLVGRPMDNIYLFRVKKDKIGTRSDYEFFSGTVENPQWSYNIADKKTIFYDPNGVEWGVQCVYHKASERYLLIVRQRDGNSGKWGLFEGENPWGPWKTIGYGSDFPEWTYAPGWKDRPAFTHSFPAKWMSDDGKTMWCIFDRGDHFNIALTNLTLAPEPPCPPRNLRLTYRRPYHNGKGKMKQSSRNFF